MIDKIFWLLVITIVMLLSLEGFKELIRWLNKKRFEQYKDN